MHSGFLETGVTEPSSPQTQRPRHQRREAGSALQGGEGQPFAPPSNCADRFLSSRLATGTQLISSLGRQTGASGCLSFAICHLFASCPERREVCL